MERIEVEYEVELGGAESSEENTWDVAEELDNRKKEGYHLRLIRLHLGSTPPTVVLTFERIHPA